MEKIMERPIFLIGAARSGTTILAQILAAHPDVAFWNEPRYVWRHGNHQAIDDRRQSDEATPEVADYIRRRFGRFLDDSGRARFLEKTPGNCFRVGFMYQIFPTALFLHLQRDGRNVAASALNRWCSEPDDSAILRRFRGLEIPITALHHYAPDILRELVMRRLRPQRGYLWGPRYPGIHDDLRAGHPVAEICAHQWAHSALTANAELSIIPHAQRFELRYENLVRNPRSLLEDIQAFAGLAPADEVQQAAHEMLSSDRLGGFSKLPEDQRRLIEAVCLPAMKMLGQDPANVSTPDSRP
jgi:hypothetical protein